ncbi:hypothetical protein [Halorubrum tailed virus BLv36]|nr:hypothetical protein [Halorubrum tailed virus BLv36]
MGKYKIGVYGHSDDLVEVIGDVSDEFVADLNSPTHMMIGGSEVVLEYTHEGTWNVSVACPNGNVTHHHSIGSSELAEETNEYTEAVVIETNNLEVSKLE